MTITPRVRWWALMLFGGLALAPYPVTLFLGVVSFMIIGSAHGPESERNLLIALAYVGYPAVLVPFWWLSWRAFKAGHETRAQILAVPPVIAAVGAAIALASYAAQTWREMRDFQRAESRANEALAAESPLAAALLAFEAGDLSASGLRAADE
jgi:hypothetical protein